ncbi:hypothetical protein RirG_127040 [Rhizophagus irregularis DAOM 197198w]|uniref:HTH CENPB-type domain-containing protein n=1 Tax=Rhizophagus irregularis (strain DAOM 197198w) TaxID=1432141 RepID=A0A015JG79_RHIIW|nr:hypothetical protein RirG_127040 [Rhizophagus irregularis DAOM 197198w]
MSFVFMLVITRKLELSMWTGLNKSGIRVNESTITRTLQSKEKRLTTELANPEVKRHKPVAVPELELALKEFVLCYQHKTILSDAILIEKAKLLANELEVPQETLQVKHFFLIIYI